MWTNFLLTLLQRSLLHMLNVIVIRNCGEVRQGTCPTHSSFLKDKNGVLNSCSLLYCQIVAASVSAVSIHTDRYVQSVGYIWT